MRQTDLEVIGKGEAAEESEGGGPASAVQKTTGGEMDGQHRRE